MNHPSSIPTPNELPRRCGECGYELTGLAESGKCPECGTAFRAGEMVMFGWSEAGNLSTVPPGTLGWMIGSYLASLCLGLIMMGAIESWLGLAGVLIAASLVLVRVLQRYWLWQDSPGPIQARFGPAGFGSRVGFGGLKLTPWTVDDCVLADAYDADRLRIVIFRKSLTEQVLLDVVVTGDTEPAILGSAIERLRQQGLRWERDAG